MDLTNCQSKAFDFAADYTKQLITLATAMMTFTISYGAESFSELLFLSKLSILGGGVLLICSVAFGILRLMALTGNLDPVSRVNEVKINPIMTITSPNVRTLGIIQILLFLLGAFFIICYGGTRMFSGQEKTEELPRTMIIRQ